MCVCGSPTAPFGLGNLRVLKAGGFQSAIDFCLGRISCLILHFGQSPLAAQSFWSFPGCRDAASRSVPRFPRAPCGTSRPGRLRGLGPPHTPRPHPARAPLLTMLSCSKITGDGSSVKGLRPQNLGRRAHNTPEIHLCWDNTRSRFCLGLNGNEGQGTGHPGPLLNQE